MEDRASRAEKYRNRAEETCTVAGSMKDPKAKQLPMMVSRDYIAMAGILERLDLPEPGHKD
ncbi:MAG: hypothetical protein ACREHV_15135 [Rhizomicrobium sp.]